MKKIRFILVAVLLISIGALSQPAGAQEKTRKEKEKELQMQEEINAQLKAITEQKKAQEEMEKAMQESKKSVDEAMKEYQEQIQATDKYRDMVRVFRGTGDRSYFNGEPFVFTPGLERLDWFSHSGDNERTIWDFTKSIKENSFSNEYTFDVEPSAKTAVMTVNGDCKAGEIRIKIIMPNGKTYSDIVIDESGNLNWRKSFEVSEDENKDKIGKWKFKVDANKATGIFKISLQTY